MPQYLRPTSTVTTSNFTGDHTAIDESTFSDADTAYSTNNTTAELEVALTSGTDPEVGTGHIIRYRVAQTNSGTPNGSGTASSMTIRLMQGDTQIASVSPSLTGSYVSGSYTLTGTEADSITNYADLRLEFAVVGGGGSPANRRGAGISWAEFEIPSATTVVNLNEGAIRKSGNSLIINQVEYRNSNDDIISVTFTNGTANTNGKIVLRDSATNITTEHVIDAPAATGPTTVNNIPAGYKYAASIEIRLGGTL